VFYGEFGTDGEAFGAYAESPGAYAGTFGSINVFFMIL
jgi:hypothetical protein